MEGISSQHAWACTTLQGLLKGALRVLKQGKDGVGAEDELVSTRNIMP